MRVIPLRQGTDGWRLWRRGGVCASDVATILGVAPWEDATLDNLFREKLEGWERPTNFAMRRGTRYEDTARTLYETRAGCSAAPVCVEHDDAPWVRASLDGWCVHRFDAGHGLPWVLEAKCPNWQAHSLALAGVVPDHYRPQCQWQLLATGAGRLDYASYSAHPRFGEADRLAVVRVEPDAELQGLMLEKAEAFWVEVRRRRHGRRDAGEVAGVDRHPCPA